MPYPGGRNYAAGDNYGRGGHYAYQAGGIFSSIGKFIGGVAKTAVSLLPGPIGAVGRAITNIPRGTVSIGPGPGALGAPELTFGPAMPQGFPQFGPAVPGEITQQQPVGTMLPSGFIPGCQLKGTRPNKSGYYKQVQKGNPAQVVYIPKGSVCVKSRRMNVANPRALRRSIRRAQGFAKLARRVMTFVSAKAPKGRAKFKKR